VSTRRKPREGAKDPQNRSDKACCCGGHSAGDRHKNVKHQATAADLMVRKARRMKMKLKKDTTS
jgi:hypothetical protein